MKNKRKSPKHSNSISRKFFKNKVFLAQWSWIDLSIGVVTIFLVLLGLQNHINNRSSNLACQITGQIHTVYIQDDHFTSNIIHLKRCDILRIVDAGQQDYSLAFGVHERHVEYPGFSIQSLQTNEFIDIDALQAGHFILHDHLRDKARLIIDISQ